MFYLTLFLICVACSAGLTWIVLKLLRRFQMMDMPNARSNHATPTPRGGGIAVFDVFFSVFLILSLMEGAMPHFWPILLAGLIVAIVSLMDDMLSLPVWLRLLVQTAAVIPCTAWVLIDVSILGDFFPKYLEVIFFSALWIWFINLYNFMDGIDGITGVETIVLSAGVGVSVYLTHLPPGLILVCVTLAGTTLGFLLWNWHPARIFMGDVGSVTLGFFLGWMLLELAKFGHWQAVLILSLYYVADSTITLAKRLRNREKIFEAHAKHYYQQAVRRGLSHSAVSIAIGLFCMGLAGLALMSIVMPDSALIPLAFGVCFTGLFLYGLQHKSHGHP